MSDRARAAVLLALLAASAGGLRAQGTLSFLELQAVGAYSTASDAVELFSLMPDDVMQKPSLGFDFVHRFSNKSRDIGLLAVQARLAYDEEGEHALQLGPIGPPDLSLGVLICYESISLKSRGLMRRRGPAFSPILRMMPGSA